MTSGTLPVQRKKKKNIQMKALKITEQDIFKSILVSLFFSSSILNSAWWPTLLEQTGRRDGDVLNTLSGMNNARPDCKSLYALGGVNKGGCSVLYFLFTHLCSARWRSDVVSLKPYSRVYFFSRMKLSGLDQRTQKNSVNTHSLLHWLNQSLIRRAAAF